MTSTIEVFVPGQPVPQGSKTAYVSKSTGRPVVVDKDVRLPQWRMKITAHCLDQYADLLAGGFVLPLTGAVGARITFRMPRPQSHYGTGKNSHLLKPSAPKYPAKMPDLDKLLRAVFDGITDARLWEDDGQVVNVSTMKLYADADHPVGVTIVVGSMEKP
jgi:Holliday junction resolvase RusA-like endonuclease